MFLQLPGQDHPRWRAFRTLSPLSANLEGCDLVAFENEDMFQTEWTVREITGHPSDDDRLPVPLKGTERLNRMVILETCRGVPFPNGRDAPKRSAFIAHNAMFGKTPRQRVGVSGLLREEIRGNGPGEWNGHGGSSSKWFIALTAAVTNGTGHDERRN